MHDKNSHQASETGPGQVTFHLLIYLPKVDKHLCITKSRAIKDITLLERGVVVSGVRRMVEVNARRARLVPGWVTVFGRAYHLG